MHSICQHECKENAHNRNTANAFQTTMEQPSRTVVHAKLEMTTPDSQEELEADAAANDIVQGGKIARSIFAGSAGGGMTVSSQMEGRLNSLLGGGQVMPDGLRNMMERGFNRDFSQVRLHTDSEAVSLSSNINAKAFTHGNDIYFNQGQFSPNTSEGQKLMAHELAHVAQETGKVGRWLDRDDLREESLDLFIDNPDKIRDYYFLFFYPSEKEQIINYVKILKSHYNNGKIDFGNNRSVDASKIKMRTLLDFYNNNNNSGTYNISEYVELHHNIIEDHDCINKFFDGPVNQNLQSFDSINVIILPDMKKYDNNGHVLYENGKIVYDLAWCTSSEGFEDFIDEHPNTFVIQATSSITNLDALSEKIEGFVKKHGPLENLYIGGHGYIDGGGVSLNKQNNLSMSVSNCGSAQQCPVDPFFDKIAGLMKSADPNSPKDIVIIGCLSGSYPINDSNINFRDYINKYLNKIGLTNYTVTANKDSVREYEKKYTDGNNGKPAMENNNGNASNTVITTNQSCNIKESDNRYSNDYHGILHDIYKQVVCQDRTNMSPIENNYDLSILKENDDKLFIQWLVGTINNTIFNDSIPSEANLKTAFIHQLAWDRIIDNRKALFYADFGL